MRISGDFDIPVSLKTRKAFFLAAKIISSQFFQIQRLVLCHNSQIGLLVTCSKNVLLVHAQKALCWLCTLIPRRQLSTQKLHRWLRTQKSRYRSRTQKLRHWLCAQNHITSHVLPYQVIGCELKNCIFGCVLKYCVVGCILH